jgi:hypothetical protein
MVLFWFILLPLSVVNFAFLHWVAHRKVSRRLAANEQWRTLSSRERVRLRYTVRRGRAVATAPQPSR